MPYSLPPRNDGDKIGLFHQGGLSPQLVVRSFDSEIDSPGNYIVYKGGVKAKYGDSELTADVLIVRKGDSSDPAIPLNEGGYTINLRAKEAYAFGKVTVTDPDGNLKASRLWFTWDGQSEFRKGEVLGRAEDVELSIATTQIVAKTLSMTSAGFDLTNIGFWTSNWRTPLFRFDADSVFIYPGKKGVAKNVRTSLLGVQLSKITLR